MTTLTEINGVGPALAKKLESAGITTASQVASSQPNLLAEVPGVSAESAVQLINNAKAVGGSGARSTQASTDDASEVQRLKRKVAKLEAKNSKLKKSLAKAKKSKSSKRNKKSKKAKKS